MATDDELFTKLEEQGEDVVSRNLAKGIYGSQGNKRELVVEWLRMKAQSRNESSSREHIRIARSAKNAAWAAAIAAIIAAISAIIAIAS